MGPGKASSSPDHSLACDLEPNFHHPGSYSGLYLAPSSHPTFTTAGLRAGALTADTLTTCPSGLTERPLFAGSAPGRVRGSSGVGVRGLEKITLRLRNIPDPYRSPGRWVGRDFPTSFHRQ